MNRAFFVGMLVVVLGWGGVGQADDWPRFLGPHADGISSETGINKDWAANPPKTLWKTDLTDDGYAGPCAADGKVFIVDHKGKQDVVRAINLKTGKDIWAYPYEEASRANYGFARATPSYDAGKLYTLSRGGKLHCLDAKSGKVLWQKDLVAEFGGQRPQWEISASPLVDGQKVIVLPGGKDAAVVALDKTTGKVLWKGGGNDKPGYATPVAATLGGRKQYVIFNAGGALGVDAATGQTLWNFPWKTKYDVNAATPLVMGDTVFITSSYGSGGALIEVAANKAQERWRNKVIQAHFSSPIFYKDYIYGTTDPGDLVSMDPQTGEAKWRQKGFEKGTVVVVDGVLLALTGQSGELVMVEPNPQSYKELGRITPLGGQSWTAPIISDGKLIIRNKQAMVCLELKAEK